MKSQIFKKLQGSPHITRKDFWLTIIPALLWLIGVYSRPYLIETHCAKKPGTCVPASVNFFDQPSLGLERSDADRLSFWTQDLSGVIALTTPALWNGTLAWMGRISPALALGQTAVDLTIILQTAAWNGVATETTRLIVQRPRPFVYSRPEEGNNPASYVSFYSGHTSFSAASMSALFMTLLGRDAPTPLLIVIGALAQILILSTAFFRVLAGRHFITDVLTGAVMGAFVALIVALFHRKRRDIANI